MDDEILLARAGALNCVLFSRDEDLLGTHVYDPATLQGGGTNADDITDLLRGLPVRIVKETTSGLWRREQQVLEENPALIVMHRSCFDSFPDDQNLVIYPLVDNKLVAFIGYVATLNPRTKFIVYSRHSWENAEVAAKWKQDAAERFPVLAGKLETWRVPWVDAIPCGAKTLG